MAAADKVDGCPPVLKLANCHQLFITLFECKKKDNTPCITDTKIEEVMFKE